MDYTLHKFRPSETIDAIMRLKGRHNYTSEELVVLRKRFLELNGPVVPRVGDIFKIPLERLAVDDYGDLVVVSVDVPVVADPTSERQEPTDGEHAGDPRQPDRELPSEPKPTASVQEATKQDGNQQVAPNPGESPGQQHDEPAVNSSQTPTLVVSGARRRR